MGIAVHIIGHCSGLRTHLMKLSIHSVSCRLQWGHNISGHLRPASLRPSPPICGHLRPSPAMSAHLRLSPPSSGHLRPSPPISAHLRPSPPISGHLRPSPISRVAVHIIGHCSAYCEYSPWALPCILLGIAVHIMSTHLGHCSAYYWALQWVAYAPHEVVYSQR